MIVNHCRSVKARLAHFLPSNKNLVDLREHSMHKMQGFTLIELMIVLAIIGILAAIATPAYQNYIAKTQVTEALNMVSSFKGEIVSFYGESNTCPTLTGIGLPPSGLLEARYIESLAISTPIGAVCAITFTFKSDDINEGLKSKNLTVSMLAITPQGSAKWDCTSADIPQLYLPSSCRGI